MSAKDVDILSNAKIGTTCCNVDLLSDKQHELVNIFDIVTDVDVSTSIDYHQLSDSTDLDVNDVNRNCFLSALNDVSTPIDADYEHNTECGTNAGEFKSTMRELIRTSSSVSTPDP